jgi:hypothetical protein
MVTTKLTVAFRNFANARIKNESSFTACKVNSKFQSITRHNGPEGEYRYSSTLSLTSALDGSGWSTPHPGCLTSPLAPQKKTWYPLYRRLGGSKGRSGRVRKFSLTPRFDPRTIQPVASRYTDWTISAPNTTVGIKQYWKFQFHFSVSLSPIIPLLPQNSQKNTPLLH